MAVKGKTSDLGKSQWEPQVSAEKREMRKIEGMNADAKASYVLHAVLLSVQ